MSAQMSLYITIAITLILVVALMRHYNREFFNDTHSQRLPIYIISLEKHRFDRLEPLLKGLNVHDNQTNPNYYVQKVYAVNGQETVIEPFLNKGQIGCWLSHVAMWNAIIENNNSVALILEDDANIALPEMLSKFREIMAELPQDWDICYLGGRYSDPESAIFVSPNLQTSKSSVIWHSHAYLITRNGARELISQSSSFNASHNKSSFDNVTPVDDWMTDPERNLNVYKVEPELVSFKYDGISETSNGNINDKK